MLVRGPDTLVVVPPVVSIVQEALDGFSFKLLLKTCLLFDGFFVEKFLPGQGWHQVDVKSEDAKGALMGKADWLDLRIDLDLVAVEGRAPV